MDKTKAKNKPAYIKHNFLITKLIYQDKQKHLFNWFKHINVGDKLKLYSLVYTQG